MKTLQEEIIEALRDAEKICDFLVSDAVFCNASARCINHLASKRERYRELTAKVAGTSNKKKVK